MSRSYRKRPYAPGSYCGCCDTPSQMENRRERHTVKSRVRNGETVGNESRKEAKRFLVANGSYIPIKLREKEWVKKALRK